MAVVGKWCNCVCCVPEHHVTSHGEPYDPQNIIRSHSADHYGLVECVDKSLAQNDVNFTKMNAFKGVHHAEFEFSDLSED